MRRVLFTIGAGSLFLLESGSVSLPDLAIALMVGALVALIDRPPTRRSVQSSPPFTVTNLLGLPRFLFGLGKRLISGSWLMVRVLAGLRNWRHIGYVEVPLLAKSHRSSIVLGWAHTTAPGSTLVFIDEERGVMLFNVIDASDRQANEDDIRRFYEKYQRQFFP